MKLVECVYFSLVFFLLNTKHQMKRSVEKYTEMQDRIRTQNTKPKKKWMEKKLWEIAHKSYAHRNAMGQRNLFFFALDWFGRIICKSMYSHFSLYWCKYVLVCTEAAYLFRLKFDTYSDSECDKLNERRLIRVTFTQPFMNWEETQRRFVTWKLLNEL